MNNTLISIIVPIYNSEQYLNQCIESIINQSLKDIEIIIIDDGSTDSSRSIIANFQKKDNRIHYFYQNNSGVSIARNYGMEKANSKYLMFVDSDDFLELNACETLYNELKIGKFDCVIFNCSLFFNNQYYKKNSLGLERKEFDCSNNFQNYLLMRCFGLSDSELNKVEELDYLSSCCLKIYKKEIITNEHISFTDIKNIGSYEDGLFNLDYFLKCKNVLYINNYFYNYRRDNGESNTSKYKPLLNLQWSNLFTILKDKIVTNNLPSDIFNERIHNRVCLSIIGLGLNCVQDHNLSFKTKRNIIKSIINEDKYSQEVKHLKIQKMHLKWKTFFFFVKNKNYFMVTYMLCIMDRIRRKK